MGKNDKLDAAEALIELKNAEIDNLGKHLGVLIEFFKKIASIIDACDELNAAKGDQLLASKIVLGVYQRVVKLVQSYHDKAFQAQIAAFVAGYQPGVQAEIKDEEGIT